MITVYVSIGNSDDKLSQRQWSDFVLEIASQVASLGKLHGTWFSQPALPWQNACWCIGFTEAQAAEAKAAAAEIGRRYKQDSIAWAVADTEFI